MVKGITEDDETLVYNWKRKCNYSTLNFKDKIELQKAVNSLFWYVENVVIRFELKEVPLESE